MRRASPRKQRNPSPVKQPAQVTWVKHRSRGRVILLLIIIVVAAVLGVYVFHGGPPTPAGTTTQAPYSVTANPSSLPITGPGIIGFDVNVSSATGYSSQVSLSLASDAPTGIHAVFQPNAVTPTSPAVSHVTLVVDQTFPPGNFNLRIEAKSSLYTAETHLSMVLSAPSTWKNIHLLANLTSDGTPVFNATSASPVNPTITVHRGETFNITISVMPNGQDIHHYISIYPEGTQPDQVNEQGVGSYAHSTLAHSPSLNPTAAIFFTSYVLGRLEYYCDSHASTMHGVIEVIP